MPILQKRTKIDEERPPIEIREQTKVRREWLNKRLAEIKATPNRDGKIVGIGTYQRISVYEIQETEGRIQVRGVCQACCASVAIEEDGLTSLHGYTRPGYGYTIGRCLGAKELPANKDLTITNKLIESLTASAKLHDDNASKIEKEIEVITHSSVELLEVDYDAAIVQVTKKRELEKEMYKQRSLARGAKDYINSLEMYAIPVYNTSFTEVVIP